jgi:hypothetical protein
LSFPEKEDTEGTEGIEGTEGTARNEGTEQSFSDVRVRVQVRGLQRSPSPKISDFENPSDSDCKEVNISQKKSEISIFCKNPIIPFIKHMHSYLL